MARQRVVQERSMIRSYTPGVKSFPRAKWLAAPILVVLVAASATAETPPAAAPAPVNTQGAARAVANTARQVADAADEYADDDITAAGTPGGGLAAGGMGGTNAGDGSIEDVDELDGALGNGARDHNGDNQEDDEPQAGRAGGAVGGTPAFKRSRGD